MFDSGDLNKIIGDDNVEISFNLKDLCADAKIVGENNIQYVLSFQFQHKCRTLTKDECNIFIQKIRENIERNLSRDTITEIYGRVLRINKDIVECECLMDKENKIFENRVFPMILFDHIENLKIYSFVVIILKSKVRNCCGKYINK